MRPWLVLRLRGDAATADVLRRGKQLMMLLHPDRCDEPDAARAAQEVNGAKDAILAMLAQTAEPSRASPPPPAPAAAPPPRPSAPSRSPPPPAPTPAPAPGAGARSLQRRGGEKGNPKNVSGASHRSDW